MFLVYDQGMATTTPAITIEISVDGTPASESLARASEAVTRLIETLTVVDGYEIVWVDSVGDIARYDHVQEWAGRAANQLDYAPDMERIESEDLSLTIEAGDGGRFLVTSWFDVREDRGSNPLFDRIYG